MLEKRYPALAQRKQRDHNSFIWHLLSEAEVSSEEFGSLLQSYKNVQPLPTTAQLNHEQSQAASLVVNHKAPLVLLNGSPGTGKTHVLVNTINEVLNNDAACDCSQFS